jgi:hypothetical protein
MNENAENHIQMFKYSNSKKLYERQKYGKASRSSKVA